MGARLAATAQDWQPQELHMQIVGAGQRDVLREVAIHLRPSGQRAQPQLEERPPLMS
jgi:hypothetical protein